ncbi:MAG: 4-(cytidine 5'-diphospho)-2-C-methyl-D-erythritol kinase, partial [bacterium]
MSALRLRAYAKLNLTLSIHPKSGDFHPIQSLMQTISLHDELIFDTNETGRLSLFYEEPYPIPMKENLIWIALKKLQEQYSIKKGMTVWLKKRIPVGGGLGGGSSDAAATLIGACRIWELPADGIDLRTIALDIGSDVPFCMQGGTAWVEGRGERVSDLGQLNTLRFVLLFPGFSVSSREGYAWWDEDPLSQAADDVGALRSALLSGDMRRMAPHFNNAFLPILCRRFPQYEALVRQIQD